MEWTIDLPDSDAEQAVQQSRTVLTSDILVGHVMDTPLQGNREIGEGDDTVEALATADSFDFAFETPEIDITAPTDFTPIAMDRTRLDEEPVNPVRQNAPIPDGTPWNVDVFEEGRQVMTPANDLMQQATGNRIDGTELFGTRHDDILTGTTGDDVLNAAKGDDVMTGSAGADVFVFSQSSTGKDRITDFTTGEDHLYFAAETIFDLSEITITQEGDDALLSWHRGNSELLLEQVNLADLNADSFILAAA